MKVATAKPRHVHLYVGSPCQVKAFCKEGGRAASVDGNVYLWIVAFDVFGGVSPIV